jgi:hypothetical protein
MRYAQVSSRQKLLMKRMMKRMKREKRMWPAWRWDQRQAQQPRKALKKLWWKQW